MTEYIEMAFLPVIDNGLITNTPMVNLVNNIDPSVPMIVGSTDQESRLFLVPSGDINRVDKDRLSLFFK